MAPASPTGNNSYPLPFLPNSSSEPGISCTVSHWSSQQLIEVSVIILVLQKRRSERWNNLPRVTQPGSGSSAIRTKAFPGHPLCTLPSAGQVHWRQQWHDSGRNTQSDILATHFGVRPVTSPFLIHWMKHAWIKIPRTSYAPCVVACGSRSLPSVPSTSQECRGGRLLCLSHWNSHSGISLPQWFPNPSDRNIQNM